MGNMDNSVLFSLHELKALEDERIRAEAAAVDERREAERRARLEAEERARCEAEAAAQAAAAAARREAEARERARREEQLRLIQAEARMEEEAQRLLEAARLEAEARADEAIAAARRPLRNVVALSLAALLVIGALGAGLMRSEEAEAARSRAAVEQKIAEARAAVATQQEGERRRFEAEMARLRARLQAAESAAERERLEQKMAEAAAQHQRRALAVRKEGAKKVAAAAKQAGAPALPDTLLGD